MARNTLGNAVVCQSGEFSVAQYDSLVFAFDAVPVGKEALITYSIPYLSRVNLDVYDVSGRLVSKLVDGEVAPGVHTIRWTGTDDINRRCAPVG